MKSFEHPWNGRPLSTSFVVAATAIAAALSNSLSLEIARHVTHMALLWPTMGLMLAASLHWPRMQMPLLAGYFLGCAGADILIHASFLSTLVMPCICTGGLALACACVRALAGPSPEFREWRTLVRFLAAVSFAAFVTGLFSAGFMALEKGEIFAMAWAGWTLSGILSYAIFTPVICVLVRAHAEAKTVSWTTLAASVLANFVLALLAFGQTTLPVPFTIPCALLVTCLVGGLEATIASLLIDALVVIVFAVTDFGSVAMIGGNSAFHIVAAQFYVVVLSFVVLPTASAICEREKLRASLAESFARLSACEERHRILAEQSPDIIARVGLDGIILDISPGCRALGYEPAELIGADSNAFLHPDDVAHFSESARLLCEGQGTPQERLRDHRFRARSGDWVWLQSNPALVRGADGERFEIVSVLRDVTEKKRTDAELTAALSAAEAATAAKSEFLANMSHELRTPLTSVIGYSELLCALPAADEVVRQFADRIRTASLALLATINDILDFSKLEGGKFELSPEPTPLLLHARDTLELFRPQAEAKGVTLACKTAEDDCTVLVDPLRLRQVLLNLIGNALKFTDAGSVTLHIAAARDCDSDVLPLRFEIRDTGVGIAEDRVERLFQRFSQVDGSASRRYGGTGLGLSICKGLVEAMGGTIGVESRVGDGSTFWFTLALPLVRTDSEDDVAVGPESPSFATQSHSVLVVDDNEANRKLVRAALSPFNLALTEAGSGADAVRLADADAFDLVLLDIHMPGMDGITALKTIRSGGGASAQSTIIAFTADGDSERLAALQAAGFDGTLSKPISIRALLTLVAGLSASDPESEPAARVA